jgi:DNA repair exonuclease SbcCD ATPase subunit
MQQQGGCALKPNVLKFEEGTAVMMSKEEYENKLEEQLEEWSSRLSMLEIEAERQGGKDRSEHQRRIKEILDQKAALEEMIHELKNASGKKWIEIKDKVQKAQEDFEASFKTTFLEVI